METGGHAEAGTGMGAAKGFVERGAAAAGVCASTAWLAAAGGSLAGTAWQLSQAQLWSAAAYGVLLAAAACMAWCSRQRGMAALLAFALAAGAGAAGAAAITGLRAAAFLDSALSPALEGVDLRLTGVVAQMPRHSPRGLRFQFEVEQANGPPTPSGAKRRQRRQRRRRTRPSCRHALR